MPEDNLVYPSDKDIEQWLELLQSEDVNLKLKLPVVDNGWIKEILSIIERCRFPYFPVSVHNRAANIFYKIVKNHNYIDSNKRSGIVILYLFYLINDHVLIRKNMRYSGSQIDIEEMAKRVARSRSSRSENTVRKIENCLNASTRKFYP
jgi:prophage maintenance system killer protein